MKLLLIFTLVISLSGCVDKLDRAKGEQLCINDGGLFRIERHPSSRTYDIYCINGRHIWISEDMFKEITGDKVAEVLKEKE